MASSPFIGIDFSARIGKRKQQDYCIIATFVYDSQGTKFKIVSIDLPDQRKEVVLGID